MTDPIDLAPAANEVRRLAEGTSPGQLHGPTPCADLTVAGLLDHLVVVAEGSIGLIRGDADLMAAAQGGRTSLFTDGSPPARTARAVTALAEAWRDPAAWHGDGVPGLGLSNETWGRIALTELVVHGWDLAVATGQSLDLPDETLVACLDHVAAFVPNAPLPELWGPAVEVPADAPLIDRTVAVTGRTPT